MRKLYAYKKGDACPVEDFLKNINKKLHTKLLFQLAYILDESNGFLEPYVKHFSLAKYRQMYEIRVKAAETMMRIIFYEKDGEIIFLHAFYKHELTFYNEALGGIRITKLDEETRQPIKGVKFAVEYMNGKRIGTYTTNASGVINIDDLPNGWYTVIETKAADDYILDAEPHDIEVKDGEITRVTITNRKNSSFLIHKVDSTTGKGICGVTFLISDRYGNPVAQYMSDQNGYVYTDNHEFEDGKYYIREIGVPEGYVLDTEVKTFTLSTGAQARSPGITLPRRRRFKSSRSPQTIIPLTDFPQAHFLKALYLRSTTRQETL